ncbi:hypothetical protein DY000_02049219 [Brassica cretica]|uniref:Uncharacterized protein n=1 Tax=Brassica cretica TaxID=69181 RepID=A0ABQ7F007_BRACR|nr:hypothetical protein DY000_02049219 [Brassica cretica]
MSPPSSSPLSSLSVSSFSLVKQQFYSQYRTVYNERQGIVFIREWTIVLRLERSREWSFVKGVCFDQSCSPVSVFYSGDRGQML